MLQCVVSMRAAATASSEKEIRRQYDEWLAVKRLLASALLSEGPQTSAVGVDQLSAKAAELEKALAGLIGHDIIMAGVGGVSWRDVRGALAPSEAAIEIVRSPISGFPSRIEPVYAALVLRGDTADPPQMVDWGRPLRSKEMRSNVTLMTETLFGTGRTTTSGIRSGRPWLVSHAPTSRRTAFTADLT